MVHRNISTIATKHVILPRQYTVTLKVRSGKIGSSNPLSFPSLGNATYAVKLYNLSVVIRNFTIEVVVCPQVVIIFLFRSLEIQFIVGLKVPY